EQIVELKKARARLYKLFGYLPPLSHLPFPKEFASQSPKEFAFARLHSMVSFVLYQTLRHEGKDHEAIHQYLESFSITKGNLHFNHDPKYLDAPYLPLFIWEYFRQNSVDAFFGGVTSQWLEEAQKMSLMVGGKQYFEKAGFPVWIQRLEEQLAEVSKY